VLLLITTVTYSYMRAIETLHFVQSDNARRRVIPSLRSRTGLSPARGVAKNLQQPNHVIKFMKTHTKENGERKTTEEIMAEEEKIQEKTDEEGNRWRKVYFGGGEHFKNWLAQCRELGEVMVEEVDSTGYKCFEESGEKLYRIWMKIDPRKEDNLL